MKVLAADVGFGTTDILVYEPDVPIENCAKLVIPSRTQTVAREINRASNCGIAVAMYGATMGGGASGLALKEHLKRGLQFFSSPAAALTFNDNLGEVAGWGVTIVDDPVSVAPRGSVIIESGDLDIPALKLALTQLGIGVDFTGIAVAVQDHGFSPEASNRRNRFRLWRETLAQDSHLLRLAYERGDIPAAYTRMLATASLLPEYDRVVLMDTGPAALMGAMIPDAHAAGTGINLQQRLVVNIGNGHTLMAIVENERIKGLLEHHTSLLDREKLESMIMRFINNEISEAEVYDEGGHGCAPPGRTYRIEDFEPVIVTGPKRDMARGGELKLNFAAPHGDMMLAGCFGLIEAWKSKM